jgi:serine/threonine protein kinase/tetratricopeptide (TPR) repeat protein
MTLAAGRRLGPYEVLSSLGAGGMGEVYRARDTRLGRQVAVKVLPERFGADSDRLRRFADEARAASALNHPNILTIHDVGEADGSPYVVYELLEGETLREELLTGSLPPKKVLRHAIGIARGLAAAHEKGIVHRDLKPENLFVTKDGRVKILDFGLAKLTPPETFRGSLTDAPTQTPGTEPGVILGTVGYMSPEQVRGGTADRRSDIFAFGTILYEMLTGQRAFKRDTVAETMAAILKEERPPLPESGRQIPAELVRVLDHCLEKNAQERFQSAGDIAFALSALPGQPAESVSGAAPRRGSRRRLAWAGALLALLVLAGGAFLWQRGRKTGGRRIQAAASDRRSIAVLPFQNFSPDPENAFFADGMTEDILAQLSKIQNLKVVSRTSVMRYKGTQKPIREIAAELGVATILEGSVRRAGNRVRIVGQLVDASTDEHLWSETYDRQLEDVFAIQTDVAQRIAGSLQATLSSAEKKRIEGRPTENFLAYDLYLKGREQYNRLRREDNETAIEYFQKALQLDPALAPAYAGLGDAYAQRARRFGFTESWLDSSLEASRKAIALAPELPEGHKALGLAYLVKGANRESLESSRRAVDLSPSYSSAVNNVATALFALGRLDEALLWSRRAVSLDPRDPVSAVLMGTVRDALGDTAAAEASFRRALELQPDLGQTHGRLIDFYLRHRRDREALELARTPRLGPPEPSAITVGEAELVAGDPGRARELLEQILPLMRGVRLGRLSGVGVETYLASLHLRAGRRAQADALLAESLTTDQRHLENGNQDWSVPFDMACVHALRSEKDEAFRWLDLAVESGWRGWPLGTRSPLLDPLRSDERLGRLEARVAALVSEMRRRAGLS